MRITIVGAGGVGGYFGAKLAKSGCEVGFVARAHILRRCGETACPWRASWAKSTFPKCARAKMPRHSARPITFFWCVKLWDTETAVRTVAKVMAPQTAEDPGWQDWASRPLEEIRNQVTALRLKLIDRIAGLQASDYARAGIHSAFGEMSLSMWVEFFLVHEAHHLYAILQRIRER